MSFLNVTASDSNVNFKDRIIDGLSSFVNTISYFDDLFSLHAGKMNTNFYFKIKNFKKS